jgi:AraC-like DNA-binding protein
MVTIAALIGDRAARARIEAASHGFAVVRFYDTPDQLAAAVADRAASVVVADWRDSSGATIEPLVRNLHADYPTVPVLIYSRLTPDGAQDILAGGRVGATDTIIASFDDLDVPFKHRIASAQTAALADRIVVRVAKLVPESVALMVGFFFRHARSRPTVTAMAVALRAHPQTLARQCARAGLPTPGALCNWARLILATRRLEDHPPRSGLDFDRIVTEMGFQSGAAFRELLERHVGLTPTEVQERGGSTYLIDLFLGQLVMRGPSKPAIAPSLRDRRDDSPRPYGPSRPPRPTIAR